VRGIHVEVLHNLLSSFLGQDDDTYQMKELITKAGEALGFLSLENKHKCEIMMSNKLGDHPTSIISPIAVLNDPVQGIHVARILRNLRAYAEAGCVELREITATTAQVEEYIQLDRYTLCSIAKQFHAVD
jgi:hypothetical protein